MFDVCDIRHTVVFRQEQFRMGLVALRESDLWALPGTANSHSTAASDALGKSFFSDQGTHESSQPPSFSGSHLQQSWG